MDGFEELGEEADWIEENPWQALAYEAIARLRHDRTYAAIAADLAARLYTLSERYDRAN